MHPAISVILFTTLSGAGYGLAIALCFAVVPPANAAVAGGVDWLLLAAWAMAGGLVTVGLLSSLWHLGHPERFALALSQWRSSWLSREGVAALVSYVPLGAVAWLEVFAGGAPLWAMVLAAVCALVTVFCTSMIYASIKAVSSWAHPLTPLLFLICSLSSGALLAVAFAFWRGGDLGDIMLLALALVTLSWLCLGVFWRKVDTVAVASTIESATGLGDFAGGSGRVRVFDAPHMTENYLLKEFGFRIGRKHASKLRGIALVIGLMATCVVLGIAVVVEGLAPRLGVGGALVMLAALLHLLGIVITRWLFFAQARHTVMLYYGEPVISEPAPPSGKPVDS